LNVEELLRRFNVPTAPSGHHHSTHNWIQFDCPWCSPNTRKFRMGIHKTRANTNCWGCGPHWNVRTLAEVTGQSCREIGNLFRDLTRVVLLDEPVRGTLVYPPGIEPMTAPHRRYLKARGFDPEKLEKLWGLRGIAKDGEDYCWRIFIPITLHGEIVSWTTRSISDAVPKRYHSARPDQEKVDHKSVLYGEDFVRHSVVVVEGPTDVFRIGPGAVCVFGTGFKRRQVERLSKYPVRVICFDSEPEAQKRARVLTEMLAGFPGDTYRVELDAKDPGSASRKEIAQLRKHFLGDE
jgi:hypothetical protein